MIPKRIYYIWFGGQSLPEKRKKNIKTWKKYNPEYKIIQIDETNFDTNRYSFIKEAILQKKYAFASDMARLIVLYQNGGFYMDNDVELLHSLDQFLNEKSVWALENSNAINSGLMIGANKENSHLKNLINIYMSLHYSDENKEQLITTKIISSYFYRYGFEYKNKLQKLNDGTLILPSEYFAPFHWWGGGKISNKTIGIHHYDASWVTDDSLSMKGKILQELIFYIPNLGIPIFNFVKAAQSKNGGL